LDEYGCPVWSYDCESMMPERSCFELRAQIG
jgi:hypothetical protein